MNNDEIFTALSKIANKSCCKYRKYGALIIKNYELLSSGYANVPRGLGCSISLTCPRENAQTELCQDAEFFERCRVIHAEMDAILNCQDTSKLAGSDLFLLGLISKNDDIYKNAFPCSLCLRHIIKVKIQTISVFVSPGELISYDVDEIEYIDN